jgi:hypothetical protein
LQSFSMPLEMAHNQLSTFQYYLKDAQGSSWLLLHSLTWFSIIPPSVPNKQYWPLPMHKLTDTTRTFSAVSLPLHHNTWLLRIKHWRLLRDWL